jgi:mannosylglycerate hydrolase
MRKSTGEYISKTDNVLENEFLYVEINANGTLKVKDKISGREYDGLHYFEDTGDVGNYWAYYPPYNNRTYTSLTAKITTWCEDNGPLSATIGIEYNMEIPAYSHEAMYGIRGESKRSEETSILKITSWITLKKDSKRVEIRTKINNNAENHRLRVAFPTGIKAEYACASGHFTVDKRPAVPQKGIDGMYWPEMETLPMQHFVDISNDYCGIALLNNCLTEYELKDDKNSTLYLTLFRAMGNMIVTWWEAVGIFPKQKGSQLQGEMEFEYSIYPHDGNWEKGNVYSEAEKLNKPLAPYQITQHSMGHLPEKHSFFEVKPENLILSAFKRAEDRNTFIMRLYNPTGNILEGQIRFEVPIKQAYLVNLNEEQLEEIKVDEMHNINIQVSTNKIITLEVITKDQALD